MITLKIDEIKTKFLNVFFFFVHSFKSKWVRKSKSKLSVSVRNNIFRSLFVHALPLPYLVNRTLFVSNEIPPKLPFPPEQLAQYWIQIRIVLCNIGWDITFNWTFSGIILHKHSILYFNIFLLLCLHLPTRYIGSQSIKLYRTSWSISFVINLIVLDLHWTSFCWNWLENLKWKINFWLKGL